MVIQQIKNDVIFRHITMGCIRVFHVTEVQLFIGKKLIRDQSIPEEHLMTTAYIILSAICPYWNDRLDLYNPDHAQYIVSLKYGESILNTIQKGTFLGLYLL